MDADQQGLQLSLEQLDSMITIKKTSIEEEFEQKEKERKEKKKNKKKHKKEKRHRDEGQDYGDEEEDGKLGYIDNQENE